MRAGGSLSWLRETSRGLAPRLIHLRLRPARSVREDVEREQARQGDVLDAFRALHALQIPFAFELCCRPNLPPRLSWVVEEASASPMERLMGPRIRPWSLTRDRWSAPLEALRSPDVGVLTPTLHVSGGAPWRSLLTEDLPSPWSVLVPALSSLPTHTWVRWVARPRGGSGSSHLPALPHLPRSDHQTPIPVPPGHALARQMEDRRAERLRGPFWQVGGLVVGWGKEDPPNRRSVREDLAALLVALSTAPGGCGFEVAWLRTSPARRRAVGRGLRLFPPTPPLTRVLLRGGSAWMSPAEVAAWSLPWDVAGTPELLEEPDPNAWHLPLGANAAGRPVAWKVERGQGHHLVIAGETGMGKSTLLQRLGAELAAGGASLVVLDPLGETAQGVLECLPPAERARAVWISPLRSPIGINALAPPAGLEGEALRLERERRARELVNTLRRVRAERYGDTVYWGPRIEDILMRTFSLLSQCPQATIDSAAVLLRDPEHYPLPWVEGPEEREVLQRLYDGLRRESAEDLQGALRVVQEVALSRTISTMLSEPEPRWGLDRALEPGAVTLFSLERPSVGERASTYLGAAYLSLIWSQILARKDRTKVVLLLDEVQEYATGALEDLMRLGRRYNVHVLAATQSLAALSPQLRDALTTNARDLLLFRGSPADARWMREGLQMEESRDLPRLPRGSVVALLGKGSTVSILRLPSPTSTSGPNAASEQVLREAIERSREFRAMRRREGTAVPPLQPMVGPGRGAAPLSPLQAPPTTLTEPKRALPDLDVEEGGPLRQALWALLVAALEAPEGEPFEVDLGRVRALCGGEERALRQLGGRLKGCGALLRAERKEGGRSWWLLRDRLEELLPPPWPPTALAQARDRWVASQV